MKLRDARENYYAFSAKASEISRHLGFAGIAVIWIFRTTGASGGPRLDSELVRLALPIVASLGLDFLHAVTATALWGGYHRWKEKRVAEETEFEAPASINWLPLLLFWSKILVMAFAYVRLLAFLAGRLTTG